MAGRGVNAVEYVSYLAYSRPNKLSHAPNAEQILSQLADVAERNDRQARVESIQAQHKVLEQQRLATQAYARFAEARRQHPYLSPEQIAAMLDREPLFASASQHFNAVQT